MSPTTKVHDCTSICDFPDVLLTRVNTRVFSIHSGPPRPMGASLSSTITKGSPSAEKRAITLASACATAHAQACSLALRHSVRFLSTVEDGASPTDLYSVVIDFIFVRSSSALNGSPAPLGNRLPEPGKFSVSVVTFNSQPLGFGHEFHMCGRWNG